MVKSLLGNQSDSTCVQPIQFMLSSTTGALAVVAVAILRIYLGWAYVGNRLLSAAVDYEESGWWVPQLCQYSDTSQLSLTA